MRAGWRSGLLYVTILGTEGSWLWAASAFLNLGVAGGQLNVLWLWLLYPAAFLVHRGLRLLGAGRKLLYSAGVAAAGAAALLVTWAQLYTDYGVADPAWLGALRTSLSHGLEEFPPEVIVLVGGPLLGWWGWRLAQQRITFSACLLRFQFGLVMLLGVLAVTSLANVQMGEGVPLTVSFFAFAMLGMAVGRAESGWDARRPFWSALLVVAIAVVVLGGLLISYLVTPELLRLLLAPVRWLWALFLAASEFLMNLLPLPSPEASPAAPLAIPPPGTPEAAEPRFSIPAWLSTSLRVGWLVLMLGLLLAGLASISAQLWGWIRRSLSTTGGEVEPLPGAFRADLLGWLLAPLRWLLRSRRWPRRRGEPLPSEVASIRHIYRGLLRWGRAVGWPRHPFQTPSDYLETLSGLLPSRRGDLALLTQAYVVARYGPLPPSPEEVRETRARWQGLRKDLRRRRRRSLVRGSLWSEEQTR